jgi:glycosyltransferase involved in cell wall biosynthesis
LKILVVSPWRPWPENWGAAIRLANIIRGLARLGRIDLFIVPEHPPGTPTVVPPDAGVDRVEVVAQPSARWSLVGRAWWMARGSLPKAVACRDYRDVRARYERWKAPRYDLAWLFRAESYVALEPCLAEPAIVDLDDLDDYKIERRLSLRPFAGDGPVAVLPRLRGLAAVLQARRDVAIVRRLHAEISRTAAAVVVCTDLDRRRLGGSSTAVIPNGYAWQPAPVGRALAGDPPVLTFPALFTYGPNIDAARYLVRALLPAIHAALPRAQVRLVGHAGAEVRALHRPPAIVATGFVPDIRAELALADVIVVPMRYGAGTRIKILEAFAHRIPVVATPMGAEGIDAADGREVLLADTPEDFARACRLLVADAAVRTQIVEGAHRLFLARYRWDRIQERVVSLAAHVAAGRPALAP